MDLQVFIVPVSTEEKKLWLAYSPVFPGCEGRGKTKEEAIKNYKKSLDKCINALISILPDD